jgi:hypothetical protein
MITGAKIAAIVFSARPKSAMSTVLPPQDGPASTRTAVLRRCPTLLALVECPNYGANHPLARCAP